MVIDWEVDDSSIGKYVGSSLLADFLIVAHYETSLTTTGFKTYWIETGEPNAGGLTLPDNAEIVSMAADKSEAIYALIKKQDTKSVLEDGTYASLYGLILLKVEYTPIKVYTVATRWLDSIVDKETKESFSLHPAVKLFLHYPPPDSEVTPFPAVVLTGHLSETKSTGLIIYEFAQSQIKYGYNPFAVASTTSQACKYFVESTLADSPTRCLSCPAGKYLTNFACSDSCSGGYSVEPLKCERCHYSCSACTGPKRSQCTSCRSALNKFSTLLGQCFCTGESAFKNGECGSIDNTATIFQLGAERTKAPNYAFELKQKFPESFVSYSADNNNANA